MNANNEFDRLIKDKLAHGQPSVPSDAKVDIERVLIEKGLIKKDEKGRKGFYVAFSVIAFITVITAALLKFYSSDNVKSKSSIQSIEIRNQTDKQATDIVEQRENKQKAELVNTSSQQKITSDNKVEQHDSSTVDGASHSSSQSITKNKIEIGQRINNIPKLPGKSEVTTNKISPKNSNDESKLIETGKEPDASFGLKKSQNDKAEVGISGKAPISEPTVLASSSVNASSVESAESHMSGVSNESAVIDPTSESNILKSDSSKQKGVINSTDSVAIKKELPGETKSEDSSMSVVKFSAEIFGGIQQTYLQNAGTSGGGQNSTGTNSASEWIGGLKLSLFYKKHFTFGAGINYSVHHSDILYNYTTYNYDSTGVIPVSNPAHIITDFNVTEIPLLLGYYVELNKFAFHFESGVSFSMISNAQSTLMFETSLPAVDNFSGIKTVKSYSSYVGQFSALYSIGKNFQVFLQPSINVGLSEIFVGMPEKKINMISLKTGLRLNF